MVKRLKKVTLSDIAKVLNISTVTVSNALSGKPGVSDELRHSILTQAQAMGYEQRKRQHSMPAKSAHSTVGNQGNVFNLLPRGYKITQLSLALQHQQQDSTLSVQKLSSIQERDGAFEMSSAHNGSSIEEIPVYQGAIGTGHHKETGLNTGILVDKSFLRIGTSFYWELYQHVSFALADNCLSSTLLLVEHEQIESGFIPATLRNRNISALLIMGPMPSWYLNKIFALINRLDMPCTLIDHTIDDLSCPAVLSNNYLNTYRITRYLIDRGHRKLGFVGNFQLLSNITDRYYGFRRALLEAGLKLNPHYLINDRCSITGKPFEELTLEDFEHNEIKISEFPTGFVCSSDLSAYKLYQALSDAGLKVPEDVSLVGYDNYLQQSDFKQYLTTVDINMEAMSYYAVQYLLSRFTKTPLLSKVKRLEGQIIERSTVKRLN